MRIVYIGPSSTGVDIAASGQHADPDQPIDVDDELGTSLLEQDIWQAAPSTVVIDGKAVAKAITNKPAAPAEED